MAMLQQPELHLHPALQAALGDVLIESSHIAQGKNIIIKRLIVETHSEHLLLRILRRIRQTQEKIGYLPELSIEADDVSVLYFDPRPDDTTHVTRMRISPEGEFMDRWPRGFFAERDKELFDDDE
jgi:predicted ATPase